MGTQVPEHLQGQPLRRRRYFGVAHLQQVQAAGARSFYVRDRLPSNHLHVLHSVPAIWFKAKGAGEEKGRVRNCDDEAETLDHGCVKPENPRVLDLSSSSLITLIPQINFFSPLKKKKKKKKK